MSRKKPKTSIKIHGRIKPEESAHILPDLELMLEHYKPLIPSERADIDAYAQRGKITSYVLVYCSGNPGIVTGRYNFKVIGRGEQRRLKQERGEPIRVDDSYMRESEENRRKLDELLREI